MSVYSQGKFPPNQFWDYSVRLYARDGVAASCLGLQDRRGADVNVLLFCCWVAASGRGNLAEEELAAALEAVRTWREEVILPIRSLRNRLGRSVAPAPGHLADDLRRVMVDSELHAEHIEQLILTDSLTRPGVGSFDLNEQAENATQNLRRYLELIGVGPGEEDVAALNHLLAAAFPDIAAAQFPAALRA